MPIEAFAYVASYLDFETYKAVRLVCRCWSTAFSYVRPPVYPPVYFLPVEILKHVYGHLAPVDVNAARHTCRKWMIASLEYRFLNGLLEEAGFLGSVEADAEVNKEMGHPFGGEWRLSKRLATECSLRSGWTGDGFDGPTTGPAQTSSAEMTGGLEQGKPTNTSLTLSSVLDFTGVLKDQQSIHGNAASTLQYTVSVCSRFLLTFSGPIIHVFCIQDLVADTPRYCHGGFMEFLISVECPGKVVAVSMDTSQNRYSIAALLEDRKGVIFDVPKLEAMARRFGSPSPHSEPETRHLSNDWEITSTANSTPTMSLQPEVSPPMFTDIYSTSPIDDGSSPSNNKLSPLPLRLIPHTLYRNLCSKTSPPLTVAIAPSRHCTAFGCSSGIELHWQDSRTGQELSRWMDLLGPAEFIHFLPNRQPEDGEKALNQHLRLVSSRANPTHYEDPVDASQAWSYEHCRFLRAVSLSDGRHVLYTDPVDGRFCLGMGLERRFGTPKPVKRFLLEGPAKTRDGGDRMGWPGCYTAARELRWGARVAAAFGDDVWLFSVPPDWLGEEDRVRRGLEGEVERRDGLRVVRGVRIGPMPGITELAVDASGGEVTVRAFASITENGVPRATAHAYQIARHPPRPVGYWSAPFPEASSKAESQRGERVSAKGKMGDATEDIEMKHFAPGDWMHDVDTDEGYVSGDDDDGKRALEGVWNVRSPGEWRCGDAGWPGRGMQWSGNGSGTGLHGTGTRGMEFVRLEVEVLCGG